MNAGFTRAIDKIVKRPGSIVWPDFPAAVGLRSHTMLRVTTALQGALAQATGGKASAASAVYVLYYLRSLDKETRAPLLCVDGLAVGFGARPTADGTDAVYYVAQENYPVEFAEMEFGMPHRGVRRASGFGWSRALARRLRHRARCARARRRGDARRAHGQLPVSVVRRERRHERQRRRLHSQSGHAGGAASADHERRA